VHSNEKTYPAGADTPGHNSAGDRHKCDVCGSSVMEAALNASLAIIVRCAP
jgi:hypothetical protein